MGWTRRSTWIAGLGLLVGRALPTSAHEADFARWREELRREAREAGISDVTFDRAFAGVAPLPDVVERDRRQAESRLSYAEYAARVVSERRVEQGRDRLERHAALLADVTRRWGVPGRFLVALWGIESSYGEFAGGFPVIAALATLAYDGRRARFFRRELIAALRILEQGHIEPARMVGSWAGAMGQPQFMPSTFLAHAVDLDGDGRRDIWDSLPDVLASMASYLSSAGWRSGYVWGREVRLTRPLDTALVGLDHRATLQRWQQRGVRPVTGGRLPPVPLDASLVLPDGEDGPAFLVYDNFRVLMRWNRSTYFALAVGQLADAIAGRNV